MTSMQVGPTTITLNKDPSLDMRGYDYSALTAVYTCPTWGVIRHGHHLRSAGDGRAMALEAGRACHDAFAAIRLWQLAYAEELPDHADAHGQRIFGADRWGALKSTQVKTTTDRQNAMTFALEALYTSGFIDDPNDKRRTVSNMETLIITYLDRWDMKRYPIWVDDPNLPEGPVGIELPIDLLITYAGGARIRYVGRMDGLHWSDETLKHLMVHENKTGGRLDMAWSMSFAVSHQPTGYMVGASLYTGRIVQDALILGSQLPMPKSLTDGIVYEPITRGDHHVTRWLAWVSEGVKLYREYHDNVHEAPQYTHSCNRYFRPCPLVGWCSEEREAQEDMLRNFVKDEWNPLHDTGKMGE